MYVSSVNQKPVCLVKYRGTILRVTSPALGSDDLSLDRSGKSIQILLEPNAVTWHVFFYKITLRLYTIYTFTFFNTLKYRGPILRVTSPALGSDDLSHDQSGTSIQILPEPNTVTWHVFYKIMTLKDKSKSQQVQYL